MRKFLRLFMLTAVITFAISAMALAAEHSEPISESMTLTAGDTYHNVTIYGSQSADAPVVITIPKEGITVSGKKMAYNIDTDNGIRISGGYVKIVGEDGAVMYHNNKEGLSTDSIIKIDNDATLTLENVILNGRKKDCVPDSPSSSERVYHGIYNQGTLNIEKDTVITGIVTKGTGYALGCAVYTTGTVNMNGGKITGNRQYDRSGFSIIMQTDAAKLNMTGGLIYDNQGYAVNQSGGSFMMTGGLIIGQMSGNYRLDGEFRTGIVGSNSKPILDKATELTDKNQGISIPLNTASGYSVYITANPLHDITVVSEGVEYTALYNNNSWNLFEPQHTEHKVQISDKNIVLSLTNKDNMSKVIEGQVICKNGIHVIDKWSCNSDAVTLAVDENDKNKCTVTANKEGTAVITASTTDGHSDTCNVTVTNGFVINRSNVGTNILEAGKTYTDIILDGTGTGNAMVVNVPKEGITVASSASDKSCITVKGNVQLGNGGGTIFHMNEGPYSSFAIIRIEQGASLTTNGITIYGTSENNKDISDDDHSVVTAAENVEYGVYIDSSASYLSRNTQITKIHADDTIEADGVIYNNGGIFTMDQYSYIHNNYNCYAVYSVGGTQQLEQGVIVGQMPEGTEIVGINNSGIAKGVVLGLAPGTEVTVAGVNGFNERLVKVKAGESIITTSNRQVTAANGYRAVYADGKWQFSEPVAASVSYVKKENTSYTAPFDESHTIIDSTKEDAPENTGAENTIATAFTAAFNDLSGKTHILCDILIPANSVSYIKTADEGKEHFNLSAIDAEGIKKAENPAEHTIRVAYAANENEGSNFGLLVNNFYSPSAKAYIIACTDDEYNAAVKDGFYMNADANSEPAVISLN